MMATLFGPLVNASETQFRLWAPSAPSVVLLLDHGLPIPLERAEHGFWTTSVADCPPGTRYKFKIGDLEFPDPASRQQDGGSAGWSLVCAPIAPSGRREPLGPWNEAILCEVHVGTATPEGTFSGLAKRLEHFRDAGFTTLEIMPINTFPGTRNWGYDGTLICAPAESYGTREELRQLVDRAHELGLCLVLDVVYNHFGDFDNFIAHYAPEWFDQEIQTPWGPGINFEQSQVCQFYFENAQMWLSEFDFDGLRFDSIHEIKTDCRDDFLGNLATACRAVKSGAKLIVENMNNGPVWLERDASHRTKYYTAQWNDDLHHVLEFLVSGELKNGYDDPTKDAIADLQKSLSDGFVNEGGGGSEDDNSYVPFEAFVSYVQNHDQIGNRADSKRLPDRVSAEKLDFLHFVLMLAPQIPLFFMGEEAGVTTPFPFFIDLPTKESKAKQDDRYKQMREIFDEDIEDGDLPDPNEPQTFQSAKIDWSAFDLPEAQKALARFRQLTQWRRDKLWPLSSSTCLDAYTEREGNALLVRWKFEAGTMIMALNPSDYPAEITGDFAASPLSTGEFSVREKKLNLGPWSALAWTAPAP